MKPDTHQPAMTGESRAGRQSTPSPWPALAHLVVVLAAVFAGAALLLWWAQTLVESGR